MYTTPVRYGHKQAGKKLPWREAAGEVLQI